MADLTRDSDRVIADARRLRDDNRGGGRHRARAIGRGSAELRSRHWHAKLRRVLIVASGIIVGMFAAGLASGGIGMMGFLLFMVALVAAVTLAAVFPRMKTPKRADLAKGDPQAMVARTQLWLEHRRPQLPAPAAHQLDTLGTQLDALGSQLELVPAGHTVARDIRELVGETLPEMVDSYARIPTGLRREERAGSTPDRQLSDGLARISGELDHITRQLADGALDDLAVKSRYLDYRYGGGDQPLTENE